MFRKMLVPTDGSQSALKAVQVAGEIARRFDSQVTLLYVHHLPVLAMAAVGMGGMVAPDQATEELLEEGIRRILQTAQEAIGLLGERVQQEIQRGYPAEIICQVAEGGGHDLIVMGSRGLSEVRAFFLGSVSDKVSHHAPCPVLIVR